MNKICEYTLNWIESKLYEKVTIQDLIKTTGYSRRTLEKNFIKRYGISIGYYLHKRRMARAACVLRLTNLSIKDVALLFNYSSDSNFTRAFRVFFGSTPIEYRNKKTWDINKLQIPLSIDEPERVSSTVFFNESLIIEGEQVHYDAEYQNVNDRSFVRKFKDKIKLGVSTRPDGIWLSISFNIKRKLHEARNGFIGVDAIIESTNKTSSKTMRPGEYSTIKFIGNWDEYVIFSRMAYIEYLSVKEKPYIDSSCYIKFRKPVNKDEVDCEFFILISDKHPEPTKWSGLNL